MREHHDLLAVVRHVAGHVRIACDHIAAELLVTPFNGEVAMGIPGPLIKRRGRVLSQPSDEELGDLVIVYRVGVWWVCYVYVTIIFEILAVVRIYRHIGIKLTHSAEYVATQAQKLSAGIYTVICHWRKRLVCKSISWGL